MPKLVVKGGEHRGVTFPLGGAAAVVLGRDPQLPCCVPDPLVSRRHAEIALRNGKFLLCDLDSKNGTYVNGDRISTHELSFGDQIRVGSTELLFIRVHEEDALAKVRVPVSFTPCVFEDQVEVLASEALFQSPESAENYSSALVKFHRNVLSLEDPARLRYEILDAAVEILGCAKGYLLVWNQGEEEFLCVAGRGLEPEGGPLQLLLPGGESQALLKGNEALLKGNEALLTCRGNSQGTPDSLTALWAPMTHGNRSAAYLYLERGGNGAGFSETELRLFARLAEQSAVSLSKSHLFSRLTLLDREFQHRWEQVLETEKFAALRRLADNVGHEINNPLSSIICAAQMLLRELSETEAGPRTQEEVRGLAKMIESEAKQCSGIATKLLKFSRQGLGSTALVDLNKVLKACVEKIQGPLEARKGSVELRLQEDLDRIEGDAQGLAEAFGHLLDNAVEAIPIGGSVKVISRNVPEGGVEVFVEDSGPGIPESQIQRLFEPLFTTKDKGFRTGLGLSSCRYLIESHAGCVEVANGESGGARFRIWLPRG